MYRLLSRTGKASPVARQLASYSSANSSRIVSCHSNGHRYGPLHHGNWYGVVGKNYSSTASAEPFLSGSSGTYIEAMYECWQADRTSVHKVNTEVKVREDVK